MTPLQEVLDDLAAPGVDPGPVVEVVHGALRRRTRRRRAMAAGAALAAVLLVAMGVAVLGGDDSPDEVVADRPSEGETAGEEWDIFPDAPTEVAGVATASTTTVATSSSTTTIAGPSIRRSGGGSGRSPDPGAAPAAPGPAPTGAPPATTAPTTTPADQPFTATLLAVTPTVAVGGTARVKLQWSDPDLPADQQPAVSFTWGDPVVASPVNQVASLPCAGGSARKGVVEGVTRFSTPGTYTVSAAVGSCGFLQTVTTTIVVTPASLDGQPAAGVVVAFPVGTATDKVTLRFVPDVGVPLDLGAGDPLATLISGPDSQPSTVIVLPLGAVGTMEATWPGGCTSGAPVALSADPAAPPATVGVPACG